MVDLATILKVKYPNTKWYFRGDSNRYDQLVWQCPAIKPTEAEIRAFSDEVDQIIAEALLAQRHEAKLKADPGILFKLIDLMTALHAQTLLALPASVTDQIPQALLDHLTTVRQKINQIKSEN